MICTLHITNGTWIKSNALMTILSLIHMEILAQIGTQEIIFNTVEIMILMSLSPLRLAANACELTLFDLENMYNQLNSRTNNVN